METMEARLNGLTELLIENDIVLKESVIDALIEEINCNQALVDWVGKLKSIAKYGNSLVEIIIFFLGYYINNLQEEQFVELFANFFECVIVVFALYKLLEVFIDTIAMEKYYLCDSLKWDLRQIKLFWLVDYSCDTNSNDGKNKEVDNCLCHSEETRQKKQDQVVSKIKYKYLFRYKRNQ